MERLLIIAFVALLTCKASAQTKEEVEKLLGHKLMNQDEPGLSAVEASKLVGSDVYVNDTIYSYKVINDRLVVLYIGTRTQKDALAILIKGRNIISDPRTWIDSKMHVSGKVTLYKRKPAIVVTNSLQLGTRIQI
ncbi:hypothetical protein ABDD95_14580 [Mucilaginibacter sp. PAMB04274]|uniref:hypothetical protein n=1 Tax=Mucilaginibacter sp. PAMB04274 TaxID=3138568 RepID=UPI0031F6BF7D